MAPSLTAWLLSFKSSAGNCAESPCVDLQECGSAHQGNADNASPAPRPLTFAAATRNEQVRFRRRAEMRDADRSARPEVHARQRVAPSGVFCVIASTLCSHSGGKEASCSKDYPNAF